MTHEVDPYLNNNKRISRLRCSPVIFVKIQEGLFYTLMGQSQVQS